MSTPWPYPVDKMVLTMLMDKEVDFEEEPAFCEKLNECCFDITIFVKKVDKEYLVNVEIGPEAGSKYELIVSYSVSVNEITRFTEKDHWSTTEILETIATTCNKVRIKFGVSIHQPLIAENVREKTAFRYFRILCASNTFYVNPASLKRLGCDMFDKWFNDEVTHEEYSIVQELSPEDLKLLLDACCAYSTIVIHSRNVYLLGEIGVNLKIVSLVRSIDAFIGDLKTMHAVRKLECALNYRLTLVADGILKSTRGYLVKLELLYEYLQQNGESEGDLPSDVLEMLDVYDDYVIV